MLRVLVRWPVRKYPVALIVAFLLGFASPCGAVESPPQADGPGTPAGDWESVARYWLSQAEVLSAEGNRTAQSRAEAHAAGALQALGQYSEAIHHLDLALTLVTSDPAWRATLLAQRGGVQAQTDDLDGAEKSLHESIGTARRSGARSAEGAALNNLANLYRKQGQHDRAADSYRQSAAVAATLNRPLDEGRAQVNLAKLLASTADRGGTARALDAATAALARADEQREKTYLLLSIGQAWYGETALLAGDEKSQAGLKGASAIAMAGALAGQTGDWRAASYAAGYAGMFAAAQGESAEALTALRKALFLSQQGAAPEIQYRWEWQMARVLRVQGDKDGALAALRRSAELLRGIRASLMRESGASAANFQEQVSPVLLDLADALLRRAADSSGDAQQSDLREARDVLELRRAAELEEYFQDDCVTAVRARIKRLEQTLSADTAVLYPILLEDRTELLVSFGRHLERFGVPAPGSAIKAQVDVFRRHLEKRTTREYLGEARQLYDWLVRPVAGALAERNIRTLVIVPDTALSKAPFAALNDGERFLVERYALAITPGLDLTDPRPIRRGRADVLMAGLSVPVAGYPGLPHVQSELKQIQSLVGGVAMRDQQFTSSSVGDALRKRPYSIVHIASHGEFGGTVGKSFLVTYNGRLMMKDLQGQMALSRYREEAPIELLTLSACQTAAGDEWSALGLAGVAVQAGVRSALASLWSIDDEVTSLLVTEFYHELQNADVSKAQALQRAQLGMLADARYRHPGYWAPFLLIGNWL